jgi:hypothetical protein
MDDNLISIIMLSVILESRLGECLSAKYHSVECHFSSWRSAKCYYSKVVAPAAVKNQRFKFF